MLDVLGAEVPTRARPRAPEVGAAPPRRRRSRRTRRQRWGGPRSRSPGHGPGRSHGVVRSRAPIAIAAAARATRPTGDLHGVKGLERFSSSSPGNKPASRSVTS